MAQANRLTPESASIGLRGMRDRVEALGGSIAGAVRDRNDVACGRSALPPSLDPSPRLDAQHRGARAHRVVTGERESVLQDAPSAPPELTVLAVHSDLITGHLEGEILWPPSVGEHEGSVRPELEGQWPRVSLVQFTVVVQIGGRELIANVIVVVQAEPSSSLDPASVEGADRDRLPCAHHTFGR